MPEVKSYDEGLQSLGLLPERLPQGWEVDLNDSPGSLINPNGGKVSLGSNAISAEEASGLGLPRTLQGAHIWEVMRAGDGKLYGYFSASPHWEVGGGTLSSEPNKMDAIWSPIPDELVALI